MLPRAEVQTAPEEPPPQVQEVDSESTSTPTEIDAPQENSEEEVVVPEDIDDTLVRIALLDTGIKSEYFYSDNLSEGYNYITETTETEDIIGHGSEIAGIIIPTIYEETLSLAENAVIVPLVISTVVDGEEINADAAMLALAVRDAVDIYKCDVINMSLGITKPDEELEEAILYAEERGVTIVASAGNIITGEYDEIYYPAAYETVIGVGSINRSGVVSIFSARNESVKLVADGEMIPVIRDNMLTFSEGTSLSSGFVTATAAMMKEVNKDITSLDIRDILYSTALDIEGTGYDYSSGYGILNISKSVEIAETKQVNEEDT